MNRSAETTAAASKQLHNPPLQQPNQLIQKLQIKPKKPSRKHFFGLIPACPLQNSFTEDRGKFSNFVSVPSQYLIGENELEPLKLTQIDSAVYKEGIIKQIQKKQTRNLLKTWARFEGVKKEEEIDDLNSRIEDQIRDQLEQEELKVKRMLKQHEPQKILPKISNFTHILYHIDNIEKCHYQVRDSQKRAARRTERAQMDIQRATQELPFQATEALLPMKQFASQITSNPRKRNAYLKTKFKQVFAKVYRLHRFNISLDDVKQGKIFPKAPLTSKLSRAFMMAVKSGETDTVQRHLLEDKHLVHQFDSVASPHPALPDSAALGCQTRILSSERTAAGERSRHPRSRLSRKNSSALLLLK